MFDNVNEFDFDSVVYGNNNVVDNDMIVDIDMMNYNGQMPMQGDFSNPVSEPVQQKVIHKTIVHEVPHVCPIHTKIINHHIFKHTYRPEYSCCEENVVSNVNEGSCCNY